MMTWYSEFCRSQRRLVTIFVFGMSLFLLPGLLRLEFDEEPTAVFARHGAEFQRLEQLEEDFGPDDNDIVLLIDGGDLFTAESLGAIRTLVSRLRRADGVEAVFSIFDLRRRGSELIRLIPPDHGTPQRLEAARRDALRHPMAAGHFLSADAGMMAVTVQLSGRDPSLAEAASRMAELRRMAEAAVQGTPLRVRFAGHHPVRLSIVDSLRGEMNSLLMLSAAIAMLLAWALLRGPVAVALAVSGPAVGVLWTMGALGLAGEKINGLNTILPSVLFVIGFTDSVHLLFDIRRGLTPDADPRQTVCDTIREVGPACLLTSLTTLAGFGSLMAAEVEGIRRFGAAFAAGTLLSFLAVLTVVPLLAGTRGGASALRGRGPGRFRQRISRIWEQARLRTDGEAWSWHLRHPRLVSGLFLLITFGLTAVALTLRPDIRWVEMLPEDSQAVAVTRDCDATFGGALLASVVVEWPESLDWQSPEVREAVAEVHRILEREPLLRNPFSYLNVAAAFSRSGMVSDSGPAAAIAPLTGEGLEMVGRLPEHSRSRFLRPDLRRCVVTVHVPDLGAAKLLPAFDRIERQLRNPERIRSGLRCHLTGTVVVAARNMHHLIGDLGRSLTLAAVIIFGLMAVATRSLRLAAISVLPNLFPLSVIGGYLAVTGEPLRLNSAMTFCVCLGIVVDDTIHFLNRYQRERQRGTDNRESIRRSVAAVGVPMVVTSAILLAGFGSMVISDLPPIRLFGGLVSIALLTALVGDLIILPALLTCWGPQERIAVMDGTVQEESNRV